MLSTAAEPLSPREHLAPASSIRPLVAVMMLVATILFVLFDSAALVTVWKGSIEYQGADFTQQGSKIVVADVTDPALYRRGVRPGQTISWQGRSEWRAAYPRPGDTVQVNTPSGAVPVRATYQTFGPALAAVAVTSILGSIAVLIFAGILCYRKPGIMTIAFWLFVAVDLNVGWLMNVYAQAPEPLGYALVLFIFAVLGGWSYYPLVWFALRFPDDRITDRAMRAADYCWTAISIVALVWFFFALSRATFPGASLGAPGENQFWRYTLPQNIPNVAGIAAFLWVYARSGEATRQRALWAVVGFMLMIVFETIGNFATEVTPELYFAGNIALMLAAFCPLALAYAVLRHHLLDISFVVNRALVYTALTALIVLIVRFVDWLAGKYLFETRAALAVEATVIIGLGFVLQRVHGALERVVDRVIFAARHSAERHIERVIAGLAYARTHNVILQAVVEEPRVALDLTSCGVFIDNGDAFALKLQWGWTTGENARVERDDPLARLLLSERRVIVIGEAYWHSGVTGLTAGSLDIAIPLFSRNDLLGIALYGGHRNGSAIDPEERKLLQRLCDAAAVAYEAVELTQAREELAAMRSRTAASLESNVTLGA